MMNSTHKYKPTDKMSNVVCRNYSLISVMSRFGLPLGFGEKTIQEVCDSQNVDCKTFLIVLNFWEEEQYGYEFDVDIDADAISLLSLVDYLKQAHSYFLDFCLPYIRNKLCSALEQEPEKDDVVQSILMFYDKYVAEVRRHMEYENTYVFDYVEKLLSGNVENEYRISVFAQKHNHIDQKLSELKNIIIKYYPQKQCNNLLNMTLFDIFNCESDLRLHCKFEDYIFTPAVAKLEMELLNER